MAKNIQVPTTDRPDKSLSDRVWEMEPDETRKSTGWIEAGLVDHVRFKALRKEIRDSVKPLLLEAYEAGHKQGFLKAICILRDDLKAIK